MAIETIVTAAGQRNYDRFHFASAVKSRGIVFCSGVVGTGADGRVPESLEEEFDCAFKGIGEVLEAAGAQFGDILEMTSYHIGLNAHMGEFMAARDKYLSEPWPAWTAIGTTELAMPGAHVEIRVTAQLPD